MGGAGEVVDEISLSREECNKLTHSVFIPQVQGFSSKKERYNSGVIHYLDWLMARVVCYGTSNFEVWPALYLQYQ